MGSRDKSLQDKLKVFFKKSTSATLPAPNELFVTAELERELSSEVPLHRRLRAIKEVAEKAINARVQEGGVEKLWTCTRDLLDDSNSEARHEVLRLLRCIAEGQADQLQIMRTIFFHYLRDTHPTHSPEDTLLRFKLLHTLTNSGKNINCFEEEIGPFLLEWLPQIHSPSLLVDFLLLIINVVKFNATYLDEHIVHGIVIAACQLCVYCAEAGVVSACLALLEAVVSYSLLPRAALPAFVGALCRTVNMEHYCQNSWKLMRYVVGADIGHAALQEMVEILRNGGSSAGAKELTRGHSGTPGNTEAGGVSGTGGTAENPGAGDSSLARVTSGAPTQDENDAGLIRGAVFYINMALWGPRRVPTLKVSFLAVLPAFLKALEGGAAVVTYEVVVGVASCVARAPHELCEPAWDVLLRILRRLVALDKSYSPPNELIHSRLHALLTSIEELADADQFHGDTDALLDLIDLCGHDRPEASTMRLVRLRAAALTASGAAWVGAALALADKYLRHEPRLAVRLHTLQHILAFIKRNRWVYGWELVEVVGAPVLGACALDAEGALRAAAARALTELARFPPAPAATAPHRPHPHPPDAATDLIDLLEKILNRPFEMWVTEVPIPAEAEVSDLRLACAGLVELVHARLVTAPGATAARCLLVLLDHLDAHYRRPALFLHHPDIRAKIFELLFGLRANEFNCVGFCYDASGAPVSGAASLRIRPLCSPFLLAEPPAARGHPPAPLRDLPPGACVLPVGRAARTLTAALTRETEWSVLAGILRALPVLLHARALATGRRAQDLDMLASTLCSMISDRSLYFPECVRVQGGGSGGSGKLLVSEFHAAALPALAALAPYHAFLEPQTQQRIVRCLLKYGMVLRTPAPYIVALTVFTLETRDTMVRMLPEVLLDLSKISDTQAIASPMLEFLSTLTRLPKVFASFVEDQYMSVFAILLPYTNPSRYNHYVVSLAHHVIAAWFLKCRLQYRRNFVRFIIHGLHNYIIMPFEEQLQYKSNYPGGAPGNNEDSSNRQRSSSLGSRAAPRPSVGRATSASASAAFHVELTETCVDLLARYASTPASVKPHRNELAEFLFTGGQSMTWLVGHKLITITTSGCHQNSINQGLCDRCLALCNQHAESVASPLPPLGMPASAGAATVIADQLEHNGHATHAESAPPQLQVNDAESEPPPDPPPATPHHPPEVKRYSKYSLQHSRSTDTSGSLSISISDLHPFSSGHTTRQNSSENSKATDPMLEVLNQFSQRFERISKEVDAEESGWSRVGALAASGACPCWCGAWAAVHVRSPAGDVSWLMRLQNQMNWDNLVESPLADVAALLNPVAATHPAGRGEPSREVTASETSGRSRSGSACSNPRTQPLPQDLHKSSSDSVVAERGQQRPRAAPRSPPPPHPHPPPLSGSRMSTQPINIPGSPQRQSSSSTTDEDDMLLILPEGKARAPVRRSNSSPEMSASWQARPVHPGPSARPPSTTGQLPGGEPLPGPRPDAEPSPEPLGADSEMILLPSCEPANPPGGGGAGGGAGGHGKKPVKKCDMRVSCEAIPEEIYGTSPLHQHQHHHHLMTFNSDPGTVSPAPADAPAAAGAAAPAAASAAQDNAQPSAGERTHHQLQKTASDGTVAEGRRPPRAPTRDRDDLPPLARSKRSNTISVMSPTRRHRPSPSPQSGASAGGGGASGSAGGSGGGAGGGVTPSFVFLQLYHNMSTYPITPPVPGEAASGALSAAAERPLRVAGEQHERALKNLDLVPPVEIYKVGVVYVGAGQAECETSILRNAHGSVRYAEFLARLGSLVSLDAGPAPAPAAPALFLNLELGGKDGAYTYVWHDDIMQVVFHVATAMPTTANDPNCNEKRKYIGNDYVSIVYNDSGADFNIHTIKGQFNFCIVIVEPRPHGMNRVLMKSKDERIRGEFLPHLETLFVSDDNAALLARQMALHAALAAQISQSLKLGGLPYASNSLERLRAIKRLRRRLEAERAARAAQAPKPYAPPPAPHAALRLAIDDFNCYT